MTLSVGSDYKDVIALVNVLDAQVVALQASLDAIQAGGVILTDTQTFATGIAADITWGTEVFDPDGWTSGGSATLTVPVGKGGRYSINCFGVWSGPGGVCGCYINGADIAEAQPFGTFGNGFVLSFTYTLVAGNTIKFAAKHLAGVNRDLVSRLEIRPTL